MGPDKIPPKLVKLATNIIHCHIIYNILNLSISSSMFPERAKIALMLDQCTKKDKTEKIKTIDQSQFYDLSLKFMKNLFKSLQLLL